MPELIAPVRHLKYRAGQKEAFLAQLSLDNRAKSIITADTAEAIFLNNQALFAGKYQMTQTGAEQYLTEIAKGLYQTVRSLAAETRPEIDTQKLPALVAQLVNRSLVYRFPAIRGRRAVCCTARNQLDGFVSRSYAMVTNEQVYGLFSDACDVFRFRTHLLCGALDGRDMTAVVASPEPIKLLGGAKSCLHVGALCQNGETAGRAIRATTIILDSKSRSWSVAPFDKDLRISHLRSRKLRDRMMVMGDALATKQLFACTVAPRYAASAEKRVAKTWDEAAIKQFRAKLSVIGEHYYVHASHIDSVVELLPTARRIAPSAQDVYQACLQVADNIAVGLSVPVRQLAYRLVFG